MIFGVANPVSAIKSLFNHDQKYNTSTRFDMMLQIPPAVNDEIVVTEISVVTFTMNIMAIVWIDTLLYDGVKKST